MTTNRQRCGASMSRNRMTGPCSRSNGLVRSAVSMVAISSSDPALTCCQGSSTRLGMTWTARLRLACRKLARRLAWRISNRAAQSRSNSTSRVPVASTAIAMTYGSAAPSLPSLSAVSAAIEKSPCCSGLSAITSSMDAGSTPDRVCVIPWYSRIRSARPVRPRTALMPTSGRGGCPPARRSPHRLPPQPLPAPRVRDVRRPGAG